MGEPRILLYDVETSPNLGYVWSKYQQDVIAFEEEWHLLSFAWKWRGEKKVQVLGQDDWPAQFRRDPTDDRSLAWNLHQLMDEADVTIAHNGDRFDLRKANARFVIHGFPPPSPSRSIDTLKIARRRFMFTSNKLGDLGHALNVGGKAPTGGFATWLGCMGGDPKAWAKMKKYNKADVELLERVYDKLLPWADNHPNLSLISGRPDACPKCGVEGQMIMRQKNRHYGVTRSNVYQCKACMAYSSCRIAMKEKGPLYK